MLPKKLVFVDLETTGARSAFDRILEVGIIRVEENEITKTYHSLINPLTHIPPEIQRITGIKPEDIINAPLFSTIRDELFETLDDCVFVAHNVRFDYGFLKSEFFRCGTTFSPKQICTVKLSQSLFPQYRHHNLDSIIERFTIPCSQRHRALDDAKVIYQFYQKIQELLPNDQVLTAVNKVMKKPSLPLHLNIVDVEKLPELPGVYIFTGEKGSPLYIGKSKNIRERVLSHFSSDIRRNVEMKISQQIRAIETIPTAGELGALLLESRLIKEQLPLYNRQLRLKQQLTGLFMEKTNNEYNSLHTETISFLSPNDVAESSDPAAKRILIALFRSKKKADDYICTITKEYGLCEKLVGLEKTDSSCFGYRLEKCQGACINKETPLRYNLRLTEALHHEKLKPWPFTGPIIITEHQEGNELTEHFLIDQWCLLGSVTADTWNGTTDIPLSAQFDLDMYKIIRKYLSIPAHMKNVKEISAKERLHLRTETPFSL